MYKPLQAAHEPCNSDRRNRCTCSFGDVQARGQQAEVAVGVPQLRDDAVDLEPEPQLLQLVEGGARNDAA